MTGLARWRLQYYLVGVYSFISLAFTVLSHLRVLFQQHTVTKHPKYNTLTKLESLKLCKESYSINCIQIKGVDILYAKFMPFIYTKQTLHTCFRLFACALLQKSLVYVRTALAAFFSKIPSSACSVFRQAVEFVCVT